MKVVKGGIQEFKLSPENKLLTQPETLAKKAKKNKGDKGEVLGGKVANYLNVPSGIKLPSKGTHVAPTGAEWTHAIRRDPYRTSGTSERHPNWVQGLKEIMEFISPQSILNNRKPKRKAGLGKLNHSSLLTFLLEALADPLSAELKLDLCRYLKETPRKEDDNKEIVQVAIRQEWLGWATTLSCSVDYSLKGTGFQDQGHHERNYMRNLTDYTSQYPLDNLKVSINEVSKYLKLDQAGMKSAMPSLCQNKHAAAQQFKGKVGREIWMHGQMKVGFKVKLRNKHGILSNIEYIVTQAMALFAVSHLLVFTIYLANTSLKSYGSMVPQIGWLRANLYRVEYMEGGLSQLTEATLCKRARFEALDS